MLLVIGLAALSLMSCTPAALAQGRRVLVPTNNGWAYAKEEARRRSEQSDTAFLFRRVHGHWHVAAYSDVFVNQPGVSRAVLKALGLER